MVASKTSAACKNYPYNIWAILILTLSHYQKIKFLLNFETSENPSDVKSGHKDVIKSHICHKTKSLGS